ncbi:MAG: tannase/feruloyl esterase family alpha/beta hydrolase [Steroidobacteraceae bacterium]
MKHANLLALTASLSALTVTASAATTAPAATQGTDVVPALACADMTRQSFGDVVIESASPVAAGSKVVTFLGATVTLPAHCLLSGAIAKRTGIDGKPYQITFELRLPDRWNGRFLMQGGGGLDGFLSPAVGGFSPNDNALQRGFAVVSTDFGHRDSRKPGEAGDFGLDPQARRDYAYNAQDRVTVTAKRLVSAYYDKAPHHSYFNGCSGGGRQGMIMSQRFPTYYDGIVSGSPAIHLTDLSVSMFGRYQAAARLVPKGADGMPDLAKAISDADLKLVADAVVAKCDTGDGIKDGIIHNMKACTFDPNTLLCSAGKTESCLSQDKLTMVKAMVAPTVDSKGNVLYPGVPWDAGIGDPTWRMFRLTGMPGQTVLQGSRGAFVLFMTPPAPDENPFTTDIDRWQTRAAEMARMTHPVDPDLSAFRKHGGKILFHHGYSDQIMSANDMIDYYDKVVALNGSVDNTQEFARMFIVPGMLHCFGGPGMTDFNTLDAIVDWVEKGKAPDRIIASNERVFPGRTRPLCPYPAQTMYKGGDPEKADSFECRR